MVKFFLVSPPTLTNTPIQLHVYTFLHQWLSHAIIVWGPLHCTVVMEHPICNNVIWRYACIPGFGSMSVICTRITAYSRQFAWLSPCRFNVFDSGD